MKKVILLVITIMILTLTGCTPYTKVTIYTTPIGAEVYSGNTLLGVSPFVIEPRINSNVCIPDTIVAKWASGAEANEEVNVCAGYAYTYNIQRPKHKNLDADLSQASIMTQRLKIAQYQQEIERRAQVKELGKTIKAIFSGGSTTNSYSNHSTSSISSSNTNDYKYIGNSGTKYKYDLNDDSDRIKYEYDLDAQFNDEMNANPGVEIDNDFGQYGGGNSGW